MKTTRQMRKLNMFLSILGIIAVYVFLHERIPDHFHVPLIIGLGIVAVVSVIYGFTPVAERDNDEDNN